MNNRKHKVPTTKTEIIAFIQNELGVKVERIEQLGNGIVYCKLFEKLYPGSINLKKLKLNPKVDYDNLHNLKLL